MIEAAARYEAQRSTPPRTANRTFQGLGLEAALTEKGAEARTGILVIDLRTGDSSNWVRLSGVVTELYDGVMLPGVVRPMALGFRNDEVQRMISVGPSPHA